MARPTDEQLKHALATAKQLREQGRDADHLAKTLLYLLERNQHLERVFHAADAYINFGQFTQRHTELVKAIESSKRADASGNDAEEPNIGLS